MCLPGKLFQANACMLRMPEKGMMIRRQMIKREKKVKEIKEKERRGKERK